MNWDLLLNVGTATFSAVTLGMIIGQSERVFRARSRRPLPFTQIWLSMCSRHMHYDSTCPTCNAGQWHSVVKLGFMSKLHDRHYMVWIRMVNWHMWLFRPKEWKEFIASLDRRNL